MDIIKKEIDGIDYGIIKLSAFSALPVLTKITKIAGPSIVKILIGALGSEGGVKKAMNGDVAEMFNKVSGDFDSFFEKLNEQEIKDIARGVLKKDLFIANGVKVSDLEVHFSGHDVFHFLKVLQFALRVNFLGFLPEDKDK